MKSRLCYALLLLLFNVLLAAIWVQSRSVLVNSASDLVRPSNIKSERVFTSDQVADQTDHNGDGRIRIKKQSADSEEEEPSKVPAVSGETDGKVTKEEASVAVNKNDTTKEDQPKAGTRESAVSKAKADQKKEPKKEKSILKEDKSESENGKASKTTPITSNKLEAKEPSSSTTMATETTKPTKKMTKAVENIHGNPAGRVLDGKLNQTQEFGYHLELDVEKNNKTHDGQIDGGEDDDSLSDESIATKSDRPDLKGRKQVTTISRGSDNWNGDERSLDGEGKAFQTKFGLSPSAKDDVAPKNEIETFLVSLICVAGFGLLVGLLIGLLIFGSD